VTSPDATPASVHVLGTVYGVTPEGVRVDVPSASQRRLLGLLAIHAPRQLRTEWPAEVLGVTTGALRTTVSRLRTTIGPATLRTTSTGYSLEGDQYEAMIKVLHLEGLPTGQRVHVSGPTEGGYLISVLWDSKEQSEAFMQNTLVPALPVAGGFTGPPEERAAHVAHHETA
jgi:hypothetical protein